MGLSREDSRTLRDALALLSSLTHLEQAEPIHYELTRIADNTERYLPKMVQLLSKLLAASSEEPDEMTNFAVDVAPRPAVEDPARKRQRLINEHLRDLNLSPHRAKILVSYTTLLRKSFVPYDDLAPEAVGDILAITEIEAVAVMRALVNIGVIHTGGYNDAYRLSDFKEDSDSSADDNSDDHLPF